MSKASTSSHGLALRHVLLLLPPPSPTRIMTFEQYNELVSSQDKSFQLIGGDLILKGVILEEIGKRPYMWKVGRNKGYATKREYSFVAIDVWKRTEALLHWDRIYTFFRTCRNALRTKVRRAVFLRKMNREETVAHLWSWDVFGYFQYMLANFEHYFTRGTIMECENEDDSLDLEMEVIEVTDDEDLLVDSSPRTDREASEQRQQPTLQTAVPSGSIQKLPGNQGLMYRAISPRVNHNTPAHSSARKRKADYEQFHELKEPKNEEPDPEPESADPHRIQDLLKEPKKEGDHSLVLARDRNTFAPQPPPAASKPTVKHNFKKDLETITWQALRVSMEQPEQKRLLRKALYETVLQCDMKRYTSTKELFKDLANG